MQSKVIVLTKDEKKSYFERPERRKKKLTLAFGTRKEDPRLRCLYLIGQDV